MHASACMELCRAWYKYILMYIHFWLKPHTAVVEIKDS